MTDEPPPGTPDGAEDGAQAARPRSPKDQMVYLLSLPERALRTGSGLVGGVLRESASLLVPQSFQSSRTYTVMVRQMLDFLVHDVGGVAPGETPSSTSDIDNYVARKAVGNFVDMAALATLHVSPLMLLAAVSDVAYGSQVYLKELVAELKAQGVIDERSKIDHVNDLLTAVSVASEAAGTVFNTPPLSVEAMRDSIDQVRAAATGAQGEQVPSEAEVREMWDDMRKIADREGVGMLAVSGAATMHSLGTIGTLSRGALSTVKVAGSLFDRHVLDHYSRSLAEIRSRGLYQTVAETSEPYIAAVWTNFQTAKPTVTEDLLSGKLLGGSWRAVRRWLGREQAPASGQPANEAGDGDRSHGERGAD